MNIDKSKIRNTWWEDLEGNELPTVDDYGNDLVRPVNIPEECFYHSCFPCRVTEEVSHYGYHPKGIDKLLIKIPFLKNKVKKRIGKTFQHIYSINNTIGRGSQDIIIAMVNSGDYTLSEAMYVWSHSCERCMNVLERKYMGEGYGYEEHSEEWNKINTVCEYCMDENR